VPGVKKRHYDSPLRAAQAASSRAAILEAASSLFTAQGYGATTVDQIAQRAGVSKPTVFSAIGNKAEVLKVVRDIAMAGDDDPRTVTEREDVAAIAAAGDLDHAIGLTARHVVDIMARYHPVHEVIRGASGTDPAVAALWETGERERRIGASHLIDRIGTPAVPRDQAVDRLWLLMAPENYDRLVVRRRWSRRAFENWVVDQIRALYGGRAGS
jgi:AcrR family transcriptional regulator